MLLKSRFVVPASKPSSMLTSGGDTTECDDQKNISHNTFQVRTAIHNIADLEYYFVLLALHFMSTLSTINALLPKESPSKNQQQKFFGNLTFRRPKPRDVLLSPLPAPAKNTICAELPSRVEEDSIFRASLYETSLRRLKKQKTSELKEINIPTVNLEKRISNITRSKLYER